VPRRPAVVGSKQFWITTPPSTEMLPPLASGMQS
jgi:hypothetical protein